MKRPLGSILKRLAIELILYGILLFVYFWFVLRYMDSWLYSLFNESLSVYSFVSLALIVAQGVVLEMITHFLLDKLGLDRIG